MANSAAAAVVAQKLSSGSPQVDVPLPRLQWIEVFDQQAPLEPHRLPVPRLFQRGQEKCGRLQPAAVQFWMSRGLEKKVTAIFTVQIDQLLAFDGPTEESPFVDGARVVVCCNGMTVDPEILAKLPPLPNTDAVWQRITKSVNGHSAQNLWRHAHARVSAVVSFKVAMRPRTQSGTIIEKTDAKGDTKLQVDVTLPTEAQAEGLAEAQPKDVVGVAAATPVASAQKLTPSQSNMRKSRTCSDVGLTLSPKLVSVIGLERGGGGDSAPPKGMPALDPNAAPPRSRDVKELVDVGVQVDSPRMAQPPDKSRPFMVDASTSTEPWEIVIARASGAPVGSTKTDGSVSTSGAVLAATSLRPSDLEADTGQCTAETLRTARPSSSVLGCGALRRGCGVAGDSDEERDVAVGVERVF